jgi:protein-tyrosine phosphatase
MTPFWVKTGNTLRLAIVPRPRGARTLARDIAELKESGVDILVSMLPADEAEELGLEQEAAACQAAGITFRSFPIRDGGVPEDVISFLGLLRELLRELHQERSVAVHCFASIGRSSLLLATLLCAEGFDAQEAFKRISKARGQQVPDTMEQVRWVETFAATLSKSGLRLAPGVGKKIS